MNTDNEQPSNEALHQAWTDVINAEDIGGARAEAWQQLIALRERRTTWFGAAENRLREALDAFIRARGASHSSTEAPC